MAFRNYKRTAAAQNFIAFDKCYKSTHVGQTVTMTVPAATAALPQLNSLVMEYVSPDYYQETVVCSGTIQKVGDTYGMLMQDTKAGETGTYVLGGLWFVGLASGLTLSANEDMYFIPASRLATNVSTSNSYAGKLMGAKVTNPTGFPAGDYALIFVTQTQL